MNYAIEILHEQIELLADLVKHAEGQERATAKARLKECKEVMESYAKGSIPNSTSNPADFIYSDVEQSEPSGTDLDVTSNAFEEIAKKNTTKFKVVKQSNGWVSVEEAFIEGYKQRALSGNETFDEISKQYAKALFEKWQSELPEPLKQFGDDAPYDTRAV